MREPWSEESFVQDIRRVGGIISNGLAGMSRLMQVALVAFTLGVVGLATPAPALAARANLCTGFSACSAAGYSNFGYATAYKNSYWDQDSGDNCTNYVGYRFSAADVGRPSWAHGGAAAWGANAPSDIVNDTPSVGAIAWWNSSTAEGSSGHVSIVQQVNSDGSFIDSDDVYGGDFHWREYTPGSYWPTGFIHLDDPALGGSSGGGTPTLSNGNFVQVSGQSAVYEIVGGAPLWVSSWNDFGGPQSVTTVTADQFANLAQYPADGTAVYDGNTNAGYVFAGGAPLYVSNWANVGSPSTVTEVDGYALAHPSSAAPIDGHVRLHPTDGTSVYDGSPGSEHGAGYVFAGGAPLYVSNWTNVGSPSTVTEVDGYALDHYATAAPLYGHVARYPTDGTAVYDDAPGSEHGAGYVFAGGAPLFVSNWSDVSDPSTVTAVDGYALDHPGTAAPLDGHVRRYPVNDTAVYDGTLGDQHGAGYVFAGGAPLFVSNWTNVGSPSTVTEVDGYALNHSGAAAPFDGHVRRYPADGTYVVGETPNRLYRILSGRARRVAYSSAVRTVVQVDQAAIDNAGLANPYNHLVSASPEVGWSMRAPLITRLPRVTLKWSVPAHQSSSYTTTSIEWASRALSRQTPLRWHALSSMTHLTAHIARFGHLRRGRDYYFRLRGNDLARRVGHWSRPIRVTRRPA